MTIGDCHCRCARAVPRGTLGWRQSARSDARIYDDAALAQLVEQILRKDEVNSSIPLSGTNHQSPNAAVCGFLHF